MTFEQLKKGLPNINEDNKNKKSIAKARYIYKAFNLDQTKAISIVSFDNCDAPRCIYSHKNIGDKGGPTTDKMKQLDLWADIGYIFRNEVPIEGFFMMQKLWCGNYVELQY